MCLLTDLCHLHQQRAGRPLCCHVPAAATTRAPPASLHKGTHAAGVAATVPRAHTGRQQTVSARVDALQGGVSRTPAGRAACVGDDYAAAIHCDEVAAVCQPAHLQREGGQVVGGHVAQQFQGVAGGEQ